MSTRTKSSTILPIILLVGIVAAFGGSKVIDTVTEFFGGITSGTTTISDGDTAFIVANNAKSEVDECDPDQLLEQRRCNIPVLIIDAAKMPYIARNIRLAWDDEGKPGVLHREEDLVRQKANRKAACTTAIKRDISGSCDEYPIASSKEGGEGARVEGVPMDEQCAQGWVVMETARVNNMQDNDPFVVVIIHPDKAASARYSGGMWLGSQLNC